MQVDGRPPERGDDDRQVLVAVRMSLQTWATWPVRPGSPGIVPTSTVRRERVEVAPPGLICSASYRLQLRYDVNTKVGIACLCQARSPQRRLTCPGQLPVMV